MAEERGGFCLSTEVNSSQEKLKWECADGHIWKATPNNVKSKNSWCPKCVKLGGITEEKVRFVFEKLLNKKFKKTRKVLKNRFELDGYNEEMNIAFEYHGEQHYYFIKGIHFVKERLEERIEMDKEKINLCTEKGIKLIIVPYWLLNRMKHLSLI